MEPAALDLRTRKLHTAMQPRLKTNILGQTIDKSPLAKLLKQRAVLIAQQKANEAKKAVAKKTDKKSSAKKSAVKDVVKKMSTRKPAPKTTVKKAHAKGKTSPAAKAKKAGKRIKKAAK